MIPHRSKWLAAVTGLLAHTISAFGQNIILPDFYADPSARVLLLVGGRSVCSQECMPLWPVGEMPNSKGILLERIEDRERVTQMDVPGMYVFLTSKEENTGSAVLIFPPGGYQKLTYNIAGLQLAKWFNTMGVNAFVVMYRLPTSPDLMERQFGPLQDGQRAMKIVRANAERWGINPERIGVMGCSAGGHLAASMCTINQDVSFIGDSFDRYSVKPNFQILVSAALSFQEIGHKGSRNALLGENPSRMLIDQFSNERHVTAECPPAFVVCAADDPVVNPENSIKYFEALREKQVEAGLHIFPHGAHSIALRNNPGSTELWTVLCEAWLNNMGFLNRTGK